MADRVQLRRALENVRRMSGPIEGVLHGAGVGKDARFDRKQAEKVDQCISAKVDGSLALMEAISKIRCVTSLALDRSLVALVRTDIPITLYRTRCFANRSIGSNACARMLKRLDFIGMRGAMWGWLQSPNETRLALEMIDMQFMPAQEGMQHLIAELESDSSANGSLITVIGIIEPFYPAETLVASDVRGSGQQIATRCCLRRAIRNSRACAFSSRS